MKKSKSICYSTLPAGQMPLVALSLALTSTTTGLPQAHHISVAVAVQWIDGHIGQSQKLVQIASIQKNSGHLSLAVIAQQKASNTYAAALRFLPRLPATRERKALIEQLAQLKQAILDVTGE